MSIKNVVPPHSQLNNLLSLYQKGKFDAAEQLSISITRSYPNHQFSWKILASVLEQTNRPVEAIKIHQKLLTLSPKDHEAYLGMGNMYKIIGKLNDAEICYCKAIKLKPDYLQAYNNLGIILKDLGKLDKSEECYKKIISIKPDFAEAYNNFGLTLKELGRPREALESYNKAIELKPDYPQAFYNLGIAFKELNKLENAILSFKKAINIKPNYYQAYYNLGVCYRELGRIDNSIDSYNNAISIKPDYAEAHHNLGRILWLNKNFKRAFEIMEWRWQTKQSIGRAFESTKPKWDGSSKKNIFLWREQGIGDEIMFSSMISELSSKTKNLIVECDHRIMPLFQRSLPKNIKFVTNRNNVNIEDYDFHLPYGSLPLHFRRKIDEFKVSASGWLQADIEKTNAIKKEISNKFNKKIIGINWRTSSKAFNSVQRNIKLEDLVIPLKNFDIALINLQYGDVSEEILEVKSKHQIEILEINNLDLYNDIDGLASLINTCDCVISIENATAHLAGSMGIDTMVLIPLVADAKWGLKSKETYLYNSMKLYRQNIQGDWTEPLLELIDDVRNYYLK